jgi:hypothetical protein
LIGLALTVVRRIVGRVGAPPLHRVKEHLVDRLALHIYTGASITRVFFISAATFGALSIWSSTTQRNLSGSGTFLFMGVIGIVIASLVELFLRSSGLDWVDFHRRRRFAGLTAHDTQRNCGCGCIYSWRRFL